MKCTECLHRFSAREALCEDWRDPEKCYGCPHCGTFYVKDPKPRVDAGFVGAVIACGVSMPAFAVLMFGIRHDEIEIIVLR